MTAFVQSVASTTHTSTTATATYTANVTSGNFLACWIFAISRYVTPSSVVDSLGQTWTQAIHYGVTSPDEQDIWLYFYPNTLGGSCTVTLNYTTAFSYTPSIMIVSEYSGVTGTIDGTITNHTTSSSPSSGAVVANAGDLVLAAFLQDYNLSSISVASPFTLRNYALNVSCGVADDLSATGSVTPTFTTNLSDPWIAASVSFAAAPSTNTYNETMTGGVYGNGSAAVSYETTYLVASTGTYGNGSASVSILAQQYSNVQPATPRFAPCVTAPNLAITQSTVLAYSKTATLCKLPSNGSTTSTCQTWLSSLGNSNWTINSFDASKGQVGLCVKNGKVPVYVSVDLPKFK